MYCKFAALLIILLHCAPFLVQ